MKKFKVVVEATVMMERIVEAEDFEAAQVKVDTSESLGHLKLVDTSLKTTDWSFSEPHFEFMDEDFEKVSLSQ